MTKEVTLPKDAILRDPSGFAGNRYDLIVIGGGIYGVTLALEAVRRGLSCLLLERDDFGGHTSYISFAYSPWRPAVSAAPESASFSGLRDGAKLVSAALPRPDKTA